MSLDVKIRDAKIRPFKGMKLSEYADPISEEYKILKNNIIAHNWFLFYELWWERDFEHNMFSHGG